MGTLSLLQAAFINNIRNRKPLPVYGKGENVRDWLYVVDHARAIDIIFHEGKVAETYNIGGFNDLDMTPAMPSTQQSCRENSVGSPAYSLRRVSRRL